jgi:hypothetical protein
MDNIVNHSIKILSRDRDHSGPAKAEAPRHKTGGGLSKVYNVDYGEGGGPTT